MNIYLLRHAIAVPRGEKEYPDDDRPLTERGRIRMRLNARGMKTLGLEFDRIFVSGLSRSVETARIVRKVLKIRTALTETAKLRPDADPAGLIDDLLALENDSSVLLVGHEPHLGALAATLIDAPLLSVQFRKGGLCRIDLDRGKRRYGTLIWHLTPSQLRRMAGAE